VVLLKPFLPETKTVSVPVEDLQVCSSPVAKYKEVTGKGIKPQNVFHQNGEGVDRLSHIGASGSKEHAHMGRRADHILLSILTTRSRSSESNPLPISIRYSRPMARQSGGLDKGIEKDLGIGTSTRAGDVFLFDLLCQ